MLSSIQLLTENTKRAFTAAKEGITLYEKKIAAVKTEQGRRFLQKNTSVSQYMVNELSAKDDL